MDLWGVGTNTSTEPKNSGVNAAAAVLDINLLYDLTNEADMLQKSELNWFNDSPTFGQTNSTAQ